MKPLFVLLTLMLCSCTQTARITLRNESRNGLAYATSSKTGVRLPAGQATEVTLAKVVTHGLDLPFVKLGSTTAAYEALLVLQRQQRVLKFELPFPVENLTTKWSQQDYLGRYLTRHLGAMVIADPAKASYWKPTGREPMLLQVTPR